MAEYIQNQTISPASAHAESLITMDHEQDETESGLTAPFNQTATEQTITFDATVDAESLFTIAQEVNQTDTSLTADFNTEFVSEVVFDINLLFDLDSDIASFDEGGIPTIFYARGETQRHIDQGTVDKLLAPFNFTFEQGVPVVSSTDAESLFTIAQTSDKTDTSLAATFSTAVV